MAMTDLQRDTFKRQLEFLGEDSIRDQLAVGKWRPGEELHGLAADFLERKEADREQALQQGEDDRKDRAVDRARVRNWIAVATVLAAALALLLRLLGVI